MNATTIHSSEVVGQLVLIETDPIRQRVKHAIAGFLAGYSGTTLEAYRLDLRGWIGWLDAAFLDPFDVEHAHIELYARWCESEGKARSTIGRRLSTICGFYKYCSYSGPRSEAAPSLFMASRPRSGGRAISARGDDASIALLCGLGRRPEEVADSLPGHVLGASSDDCVDDLSFATRSCESSAFEEVLLNRSFIRGFGFVVLEACRELVGVVEDVLDRAGHQVSRNLSRAGRA